MNRILIGDCRDSMRELIGAGVKVQTVITSPPYYALRDYGTPPTIWGGRAACAHEWGEERCVEGRRVGASTAAFCGRCGAWRGNLGLEPSPWMWVANIVEVFDQVYELLADDGTCWLNLGDCYASDGGILTPHNGLAKNRRVTQDTVSGAVRLRTGASGDNGNGAAACAPGSPTRSIGKWDTEQGAEYRWLFDGIKQKDMMGMPWAAATALRQRGWYLRQDIIWHKRNPMPESVRDRCTKAHEYLFLLAKGQWKSRVVKFSDLAGERCHFGKYVFSHYPDVGPGKFCVGLATALFDRAQRQEKFSLPPFYSQEWKQCASGDDSDFVRGLPFEHRAAVHAARFLSADSTAEEFLRELDGLRIALSNGNEFLISGAASELFDAPTVHSDGKGTVTVHYSGEICEVDFVHGALNIRRPVDCSYYYDWEAIAEPCSPNTHARLSQDVMNQNGSDRAHQGARRNGKPMRAVPPAPKDAGRDEQGLKTSERLGRGAGWRARAPGVTPKSAGLTRDSGIRSNESFHTNHSGIVDRRNKRTVWLLGSEPYKEAHFATFPTALVEPCILAGSRAGDIVFDPFMGSGTVAAVATRLGRQFLGCELNASYEPMQKKRVRQPGLVLA